VLEESGISQWEIRAYSQLVYGQFFFLDIYSLWSRWQLEGCSEISCPTSYCKLFEDRILIENESIIPPASALGACVLLWRHKKQAGDEKRDGFVRS
jgi:hypothetical protein